MFTVSSPIAGPEGEPPLRLLTLLPPWGDPGAPKTAGREEENEAGAPSDACSRYPCGKPNSLSGMSPESTARGGGQGGLKDGRSEGEGRDERAPAAWEVRYMRREACA